MCISSITLEKYVTAENGKYVNNDETILENERFVEFIGKAEASHFTYHISGGDLMVADIQGAEFSLYDPEIRSAELQDHDEGFNSCLGNLSVRAIETFSRIYQCNLYAPFVREH